MPKSVPPAPFLLARIITFRRDAGRLTTPNAVIRTRIVKAALAALLLVVGSAGVAIASVPAFAPPPAAKLVLVLYSTSAAAAMTQAGEQLFEPLLNGSDMGSVEVYSEYLDGGRFASADYQDALADFIRAKYHNRRFDLVIAMQETALGFAVKMRAALFNDAPIVFLASVLTKGMPPNATGIVSKTDFTDTIRLAKELQPDLERVFMVSGGGPVERTFEQLARSQLANFKSGVTIEYLTGLPMPDLERRLASLPERSMVYYLLLYEDQEGRLVQPIAYLDRVTAVANAPTYSWVDSVIGHGAVGGSMLNRGDAITALAGLAKRVLNGESAASIPVSSPQVQRRMVDWRQLRRWQIADVPAGVEVMFREPTLWDRYRALILFALSVLLMQTVLLGALLIHRARRLNAERDLLKSQERLQSSYLKIRSLTGRLLKEQETERARIARELHDDISQQMALLEIDLSRLSIDMPVRAEPLVDEAVARARMIGRSVHELSHRLHPSRLALIGLVPTVHALAREMQHSDVAISVTDDRVPTVLPPDLALNVFRVVQEALQNALKYSGADRVHVHLRGDGPRLDVTIADDGTGFDVNAAWGKGLGLVSMHERLEAVGGSLRIYSAPGQRTRLEVSVPLPDASEAVESSARASEARVSEVAGGR